MIRHPEGRCYGHANYERLIVYDISCKPAVDEACLRTKETEIYRRIHDLINSAVF